MWRNLLAEFIAYLFILLFLYTGISKLSEFSVFKEQIALTPLFANTAPIVAWLVPISELVISVLLFWPTWRLKGLYAALVLMTLFLGYVIYIINVDEKLPCSCGGVIESLSWKDHIAFNSIMALLAMLGIILLKKQTSRTITALQ